MLICSLDIPHLPILKAKSAPYFSQQAPPPTPHNSSSYAKLVIGGYFFPPIKNLKSNLLPGQASLQSNPTHPILKSGLSPHPTSCGSFLQCAGDELHTIDCPPGGKILLFSTSLDCWCFKFLYKCVLKIYKMLYHTIMILPGLLFNPSNKQCDWPDNVDCTTSSSSSSSATTSRPSQATSTPTVSSETSKATTTTKTTTTTGTKSTTERSSTAVPQPPASAEGPSCAGKTTLEPISDEVKKLRASTCSLENSQVTFPWNHFMNSESIGGRCGARKV